MQHPGLVALLCLVSGVAGGLLARVLPEDAPAPAAGSMMDVASFQDALQGVEERLDRLRAAVESRPFRSPGAPELAPASSKPEEGRETSPPVPGAPVAPLPAEVLHRDWESEPLPPKDDKALEQLLDSTEKNAWVEDAEFRRRWLFLTEKAALAKFGTPDSVQQNGANMTWVYQNATTRRGRTLLLYFSNGRLWRMHMNK